MITKNTIIFDVVIENPEVEKLFRKYGIKCFGWGGFAYKSIGDAARIINIDNEKLIEEINSVINNK